jgi:hypothetical protein
MASLWHAVLAQLLNATIGLNTLQAKKKTRQSSITPPASLPEGCDPWKNGRKAPQLQAEEVDVNMPSNFA